MKDSESPLANPSAPFCRSVLGDGILLFPYSGAGCSWFNCFHGQRFVFLWQLAPMYDECCSNAGFSLCSLQNWIGRCKGGSVGVVCSDQSCSVAGVQENGQGNFIVPCLFTLSWSWCEVLLCAHRNRCLYWQKHQRWVLMWQQFLGSGRSVVCPGAFLSNEIPSWIITLSGHVQKSTCMTLSLQAFFICQQLS